MKAWLQHWLTFSPLNTYCKECHGEVIQHGQRNDSLTKVKIVTMTSLKFLVLFYQIIKWINGFQIFNFTNTDNNKIKWLTDIIQIDIDIWYKISFLPFPISLLVVDLLLNLNITESCQYHQLTLALWTVWILWWR